MKTLPVLFAVLLTIGCASPQTQYNNSMRAYDQQYPNAPAYQRQQYSQWLIQRHDRNRQHLSNSMLQFGGQLNRSADAATRASGHNSDCFSLYCD